MVVDRPRGTESLPLPRLRPEGRAEVLLKLLQLRFTELPSTVEDRVRQASSEEIDRWVERVMTAQSLDDVWD
jgi:hypothetical protein